VLAAVDPANPYGAALAWPERDGELGRPQRVSGASVVMVDGELVGYLGRTERALTTFVPRASAPGADKPRGTGPRRDATTTVGDGADEARTFAFRVVADALAGLVESGRRRAMLIGEVDGAPTASSPIAPFLVARGFQATSRGFFKRTKGAPDRAA